MTVEQNRPPFMRVVAPSDSTIKPAPPSAIPPESSKEFLTFKIRVDDLDVARPINAAYLACGSYHLADEAVSFYDSAVAHAPVGSFRHDVPPGLKSAEATRAWIGMHISAIKRIAEDKSKKLYANGKELKNASLLAAAELQRAYLTAKGAGLDFDERYTSILRDIASAVPPQPTVADMEKLIAANNVALGFAAPEAPTAPATAPTVADLERLVAANNMTMYPPMTILSPSPKTFFTPLNVGLMIGGVAALGLLLYAVQKK